MRLGRAPTRSSQSHSQFGIRKAAVLHTQASSVGMVSLCLHPEGPSYGFVRGTQVTDTRSLARYLARWCVRLHDAQSSSGEVKGDAR